MSQYYEPQPLRNHFSEYLSLHEIILETTIRNTDLPDYGARITAYREQLVRLKNDFREFREKEYKAISYEVSVPHSCTKGSSGGTKNCGCKHVSAPAQGMYTKPEWVRKEGGGGTKIAGDGSRASICLRKSGRGRIRGRLYARFKYSRQFINDKVSHEINQLFLWIAEDQRISAADQESLTPGSEQTIDLAELMDDEEIITLEIQDDESGGEAEV